MAFLYFNTVHYAFTAMIRTYSGSCLLFTSEQNACEQAIFIHILYIRHHCDQSYVLPFVYSQAFTPQWSSLPCLPSTFFSVPLAIISLRSSIGSTPISSLFTQEGFQYYLQLSSFKLTLSIPRSYSLPRPTRRVHVTPHASSFAVCLCFAAGVIGRSTQHGSKTKLNTFRPFDKAPFLVPIA